jgi:hypothetical protein
VQGWAQSNVPTIPTEASIEFLHPASEQSSPETFYANAYHITVKVLLENTWGSGILVGHQGQTYTVLTNRHVLNAGTRYQIQTSDGALHTATVVQLALGDEDLGLLQFSSPTSSYPIAAFSDQLPQVGDRLYAAGYPIEDDPSQPVGFAFLNGEVSMISERAFNGGYQIGSTMAIAKGMSGGPVLNQAGEVIAVNGMHQYPLWGNPYVYPDGSSPSTLLQDQMSRYSWSVPIQTFLNLSPQFMTGTSSETPVESVPLLSEPLPQDPQPMMTTPSPDLRPTHFDSIPINPNPPSPNSEFSPVSPATPNSSPALNL